jgi:hypothetical protein
MTRASIQPKERARLTLDAIDAVEEVDAGTWTSHDLIEMSGTEIVDGLVLYCNLLEAMLHLSRACDVPTIRQAARDSAKAAGKL